MASGGEMSPSVLQGSAEVIKCPCSLCLSRDKTEVEAEKTCVDCNYNMCAACTDWHSDFPSMALHQVVDVSQTTDDCSKQDQHLTMTSSGELSPSVLQGSAEVIEYPCSLCLSRDKTEVEAEKTCVDCNYNMCAACTDLHTTFPSMAGHRIVDVSQATGGRSQQGMLPKKRCQEHHGRILDKFCTRHDQVACDSCVGIYHSSCGVLEYIPTFALGTKKSTNVQEIQQATQALLKDLNDVKSLQEAALKQTDDEEAQTQQIIQNVTMRLHKRVGEIAKAESSKAAETYNRKKASIQKTIKTVEGHIEAAEASDKDLSGFQGDNESELFIYINQGQKCERDGKNLLQHMKNTSTTQIPKYTLDDSVERTVAGIKTLGRFHKTVTAVGKREYRVRGKAETSVCDIIDICLLPDSSLIVTDLNNKSLKHLDTSYTVTARLDFHSVPGRMCSTNKDNEVAVTFADDKKVRFVSVGSRMEKTRSFSVGDFCRDICHSKGELFVCCGSIKNTSGGHVRVFDMAGSHLRTIQTNTAGQRMFSILGGITISSDGTRIYVTDNNKGMLAMDRTGKLLASYAEPDLELAKGIRLLEGEEELLVAGYFSHNVHHVTRDGRRLGVVLEEKHGIAYPSGLCYDLKQSRLIVSTRQSDTLKVFDLHVE